MYLPRWEQYGRRLRPRPSPLLPDISEDKVIARFDDGVDFTMADLKELYPALAAGVAKRREQRPGRFFHEYALMRKYMQIAEKDKLDAENPYQQALAFNRMVILYQAVLDRVFRDVTIEPAEVVNYYDSHKANYKQIRVKAIYIPFNDAPSIGDLTEAQAKTKAAKLAAEIRGGADFVKLVKENSQDETSRDKDGDFATLHVGDNIPDAIKAAVFALKQGETSDPGAPGPRLLYFPCRRGVVPAPRAGARPDLQCAENPARAGLGEQDRQRNQGRVPQPGFPAQEPAGRREVKISVRAAAIAAAGLASVLEG